MKSKTFSAIVAAAMLLFAQGCTTTAPDGSVVPPTPSQVAKASETIRLIAQTGSYLLVRDNPDLRGYFVTSATIIDNFLENGEIDPIALTEAIEEFLGGEENLDPNVSLALAGAMSAYKIWFAENIQEKLAPDHYAVIYLRALTDGLIKGASLVKPENMDDSASNENPLIEAAKAEAPTQTASK